VLYKCIVGSSELQEEKWIYPKTETELKDILKKEKGLLALTYRTLQRALYGFLARVQFLCQSKGIDALPIQFQRETARQRGLPYPERQLLP
jgi:predicted membrane GTPase involved in stress response